MVNHWLPLEAISTDLEHKRSIKAIKNSIIFMSSCMCEKLNIGVLVYICTLLLLCWCFWLSCVSWVKVLEKKYPRYSDKYWPNREIMVLLF